MNWEIKAEVKQTKQQWIEEHYKVLENSMALNDSKNAFHTIKELTESMLAEEQAGFQEGRSTGEQIFTADLWELRQAGLPHLC